MEREGLNNMENNSARAASEKRKENETLTTEETAPLNGPKANEPPPPYPGKGKHVLMQLEI